MKDSEIRKRCLHIITVYCDGADDAPRERFFVVQYALVTTIPYMVQVDGEYHSGMWKALDTWDYNGRHGRAKRSSVTIKDGNVVANPTVDEARRILRENPPDVRSGVVFLCDSCHYREKIKDTSFGNLFLALDTVARSKYPWLAQPTSSFITAMLNNVHRWSRSSADEVEVRDLVSRVRQFDAVSLRDTP